MDWKAPLVHFALLLTVSNSWGWGAVGHRIVGEVAGELASGPDQFWAANSDNLGFLANVPDKNWKSNPSTRNQESPTHYFEPDAYFDSPEDFIEFPKRWADAVAKYGEPKLRSHGTAIWRVQQLMALAGKALVGKSYKQALLMAGPMSHYVGDLSQPLHVTTNYDGQLTKQIGIHKFFETTNVENHGEDPTRAEVLRRAKNLMKDKKFLKENSGPIDVVIFNLVERSYSYQQDVLELDKKEGREGRGAEDMYELALDRMADGAATLALILKRVWKDSPDPSYGQTVKVEVPKWVQPDYTKLPEGFSFFRNGQAQGDCEL